MDTGSTREPDLGNGEKHRIARENVRLARAVLDGVPDGQEAVLVNGLTLTFLAPGGDIEQLLERIDPAECAVLPVRTETAGLTEELESMQ